ncbi:Cyclin-P3-1 [Dionaea muscipula]
MATNGAKSNCQLSESVEVLLLALVSVLEKSVQSNEKSLKASMNKRNGCWTIFHGSRAPSLSMRRYIERISKYANCSPSCFVVALIYMDRYTQRTNCSLTSLNVHRLLIASVMVAAKFLDGSMCYNNAYYARVGGVSTQELNKLEMELLSSLDFRLHVTVDTFRQYCLQLEKENRSYKSTR